jgi:hypothetical protein
MTDQNMINAAIHIEAGPPDSVRLDDSRDQCACHHEVYADDGGY